jgi:hypothetical protein
LKNWNNTFPKDKYPDGAESVLNAITTANSNNTVNNTMNEYWNQIISKEYADNKPLTEEGLKALHLKLVKDMTAIKTLTIKRDQYLRELSNIK